jgi:maltose O-acetyltransferase
MKRRMLAGELYRADDPELVADRQRARVLCARFNDLGEAEVGLRREVLGQLLGELGADVDILPTFRCDYGRQISIGERSFVNYDCIFLDTAEIRVGRDCQFGPRVQLLTPTHPIDPATRRAGWEAGEPITVGDNVWLGGGATVCPGVTIGADTVVGAGAVVTRDLPPAVVAVGSPARVIREIGPADRVRTPEL